MTPRAARGIVGRVTIHDEHPFATPAGERDQLRRFRGRLAVPVSLWTARAGERPAGLTVSSMLVALGEPGSVLGLLDPDSDLFEALEASGRVVVNVLGWEHRQLADAMAHLAPAPGGPFRMATWTDTAWGPVLDTAVAWLGARLVGEPEEVGRSMLVRCEVETVTVTEGAPLAFLQGRYRRVDA